MYEMARIVILSGAKDLIPSENKGRSDSSGIRPQNDTALLMRMKSAVIMRMPPTPAKQLVSYLKAPPQS